MHRHGAAVVGGWLDITFAISKLARPFRFRLKEGDEMPAAIDADTVLAGVKPLAFRSRS